MALSNVEKAIKERIRYTLATKKKSITSIAEDDSERIALGRQINKDETAISVRTVYKLLYALHDVDANWLILGEGIMQKTVDHPRIYNNNHTEVHDQGIGTVNMSDATIPYPVQALLDEKDKRIAELEKDKQQLQQYLAIFTAKAEEMAPKKK